MNTLWSPGRRLPSTAAILMLLTALVHTIGNFTQQLTPAELTVFDAMNALKIPSGMGMTPSISSVYWGLVLVMTVTFAGLGALNLLLAASRSTPESTLRAVAWVNLTWLAAFIAVCWREQIPPAVISGAVIAIPVVAYLLRAQPSAHS